MKTYFVKTRNISSLQAAFEDFYIETMESYDKKLDRWVERLEEGAKEKDVHISMDPV